MIRPSLYTIIRSIIRRPYRKPPVFLNDPTIFLWTTLLPHSQCRTFLSIFHREPIPPPSVTFDSKPVAYPSRLLFYYAGKRTVYLGTLKLYTVILCSYCSLIVAPSIFNDLGALVTAGVVVGSIVPLVFVQALSPPYITHAFLYLPPWAQHSKHHLMSYLRQLPADAMVQLATIRWFGRPRLTTMKVGELRIERRRFGCVNLVRQKAKGEDLFYIDPRGSPGVVSEREVVGEILRSVQQLQQRKAIR